MAVLQLIELVTSRYLSPMPFIISPVDSCAHKVKYGKLLCIHSVLGDRGKLGILHRHSEYPVKSGSFSVFEASSSLVKSL